jgi:hypothetical protein
MAELTTDQKDSLAAEVFAKTGVPVSKDDPLFALVEILSTAQERQKNDLDESTNKATTALRAVAGLVEERASKLEHIIDAYIQTRVEAANAAIDAETKRLTATIQEELHELAGTLSENIAKNLKTTVEKACVTPIRDALDVIPQRTWLESVWTLAACLAIGFGVGFIYFDATIRYSLEYQLNAVTSKLPPIHAPSPKK